MMYLYDPLFLFCESLPKIQLMLFPASQPAPCPLSKTRGFFSRVEPVPRLVSEVRAAASDVRRAGKTILVFHLRRASISSPQSGPPHTLCLCRFFKFIFKFFLFLSSLAGGKVFDSFDFVRQAARNHGFRRRVDVKVGARSRRQLLESMGM